MKLDRLAKPAKCSRCPAVMGENDLVARDDQTFDAVCLSCARHELERLGVGVPCICGGPLPANPRACIGYRCAVATCSPPCTRAHARWHASRSVTGEADHRLDAAWAVAEELEDGFTVHNGTITGRMLVEAFKGWRNAAGERR